jgi:hypothetical protein
MTIVDSDMISVTPRDEKKTTRLELSESLFGKKIFDVEQKKKRKVVQN